MHFMPSHSWGQKTPPLQCPKKNSMESKTSLFTEIEYKEMEYKEIEYKEMEYKEIEYKEME